MLIGNVNDLVRHVLPIAVIHAFSEALDAAKVIDDVVHVHSFLSMIVAFVVEDFLFKLVFVQPKCCTDDKADEALWKIEDRCPNDSDRKHVCDHRCDIDLLEDLS